MAIEIKVNNVLVYTITNEQVAILLDKYPSGSVTSEISARIAWGVGNEVRNIRQRLIQEWFPVKLAENGVATVDTDSDLLAATILAQTDSELTHVYKDRDARDAEI